MKQSGVSLPEILVVLSIAAILMMVGVSSFAALNRSLGLSNATNEMLASLSLARAEAIKRNARVVLCPSGTGTTCVVSGNWHQGWLIFHDANNNGLREANEAVILHKPALPVGCRLTETNAVHYLSYAPTGAMKKLSGAMQMTTLTVCHESGPLSASRQITVNSAGRARSQTITLASCQ